MDRDDPVLRKVPVLLIFPMALCIFPVLLIVLLGPALLKITRALSGL